MTNLIGQSEKPTPEGQSEARVLQSLILLDGSHKFVATYTSAFREQLEIKNSSQAENCAMVSFVEKVAPEKVTLVR